MSTSLTLIYNMMHLVERDFFPVQNPEPGEENQSVIVDEDILVLAFWSQRIKKELKFWPTNKIGLGVHPIAPFIVATFEQSTFILDFFVNIYEISDTKKVKKWTDDYSNRMALVLIDESTNVVESIRIIYMSKRLVTDIKLIINRQRESQSKDQILEEADYYMRYFSSRSLLYDIDQYGLEWFVNSVNTRENALY